MAGAFSLALLMSALAAPDRRAMGRSRPWSARHAGWRASPPPCCWASWAFVPGLAVLYIAWAGLGLCMAATLYEPAFAVVGRGVADGHQAGCEPWRR